MEAKVHTEVGKVKTPEIKKKTKQNPIYMVLVLVIRLSLVISILHPWAQLAMEMGWSKYTDKMVEFTYTANKMHKACFVFVFVAGSVFHFAFLPKQ